jgi:hypothetical protein
MRRRGPETFSDCISLVTVALTPGQQVEDCVAAINSGNLQAVRDAGVPVTHDHFK